MNSLFIFPTMRSATFFGRLVQGPPPKRPIAGFTGPNNGLIFDTDDSYVALVPIAFVTAAKNCVVPLMDTFICSTGNDEIGRRFIEDCVQNVYFYAKPFRRLRPV